MGSIRQDQTSFAKLTSKVVQQKETDHSYTDAIEATGGS